MFSIFLATISGVFVILSMITNANLAKRVGVFQSALVNYSMGLTGITILMIFFGNTQDLNFGHLTEIPIWAFGGGLVGAMIVASSNVVIPKIPALYTTLLFFVGQIIAGLTIDFFKFGNIPSMKLVGGSLVLAGMLYNIYVDQQNEKENKKENDMEEAAAILEV